MSYGGAKTRFCTAAAGVSVVILMLCVGAVGCGRGSGPGRTPASVVQSSVSSAAHTQSGTPSRAVNDNDKDGDKGTDDVKWGHAANSVDLGSVKALVKHYYLVAAAGDATDGCSLMYSIFEEEVAEVYGEAAGPPGLRGDNCPEVVSKLFHMERQKLKIESDTLKVTGVRVKHNRGLALLSFRGAGERDIPVHLERGTWKIDALLDGGLG